MQRHSRRTKQQVMQIIHLYASVQSMRAGPQHEVLGEEAGLVLFNYEVV